MPLVPLLAAPLLMAVALGVRERLGPTAAAFVGTLPVSIAVAVVGVGASLGRGAAATLALSAAAHVAAQVAFTLAFAATMATRGSPAAGLAAGTLVFVAGSLLVAAVPVDLAVAAALPALALGWHVATGVRPRWHGSPRRAAVGGAQRAGGARPLWQDVTVASGTVMVVVAAILGCATVLGPSAAGVLGAFPALTSVLVLATARRSGPLVAAFSLDGVLRGLVGYCAFVVSVAAAVPPLGVGAGLAVACLACGAAAALAGAAAARGAQPAASSRSFGERQGWASLPAR